MSEITRTALRYYGGKARIAEKIIRHFPPHVCYFEGFFGAGSVLLRKKPANYEYVVDVDDDVINFFQVLRDQPENLVRVLGLTPFSRRELANSYEPSDDPLERARRIYVRMSQGISGGKSTKTGWRTQKTYSDNKWVTREFRELGHLEEIAERLLSVGIECRDAFESIPSYDAPTTLFYMDPPYLGSTRSSSGGYTHDLRSDADHVRLFELLSALEGMVVVSGYQSDLYSETYEADGWSRVDFAARTQNRSATDSIWINPAAQAAARQMSLVGVAP